MIKILNASLERLGVVKNVIDSSRREEINGENVLDFEAILNSKLNDFITDATIFELDNDYFDIGLFKKATNEDGTFDITVESDHVSYRLNNEVYNVDYFTLTGTPTAILTSILTGTGFSIGTIDFTTVVTYSAQEATSRRKLLMDFVAYLGGEAYFNKFEVSILTFRGSRTTKRLIKGKNLNVVEKTVNKRQKDKAGNHLISYKCKLIYLPGDTYSLGDDVVLIQNDLGINEALRVVSVEYNPYEDKDVTLGISNYNNSLADSLYRIETSTVAKDTLYNGCRIGPEYGFEAVLSDNMARSFFNSTAFKMQKGDGTGSNWVDVLYFDPVTGTYKFVGDIVMSEGSISWDSIDPLTVPELGSYTDEEAVAAWAASGYKTYIDANGIYTGTLVASQIMAIEGITTLNITGTLNCGETLEIGPPNESGGQCHINTALEAIRVQAHVPGNYIAYWDDGGMTFYVNDIGVISIMPNGSTDLKPVPVAETNIVYKVDGTGFDTDLDGSTDSWTWTKDVDGRITKLESSNYRVVNITY